MKFERLARLVPRAGAMQDENLPEAFRMVVGDICQIVSPVTVRAEESFESERVAEVPAGPTLVIEEVGQGRRVRVRISSGVEGWISSRTKQNEPLIVKRQAEVEFATGQEGKPHEESEEAKAPPRRLKYPDQEDGPTCRICLEGEFEDDELLAPCLCRGTSQYVHRGCLDSWRISGFDPKTVTHCGTCKAKFRLEEPSDAKGAEREVWTEIVRYLGIRLGIFGAIVILLGFVTDWLFGAEVRLLSNVFLNHITVGTMAAFVLAGGWAILQALWSLNLCGLHPHAWSFDGKDAAFILLVIVAVIGAIYLLYQLLRGLWEVAQAGQQVAASTIHVRNKEMRKRVVERYRVLNYEVSSDPSSQPEAPKS